MVFVTTLYVIFCIILIILVLLQQTRGGMGMLAGSSDTVLGPSSGDFLSKATTMFAIIFVAGAVVLSILSSKESILDAGAAEKAAQTRQKQDQTDQPAPASQEQPAALPDIPAPDTSGTIPAE